jgi:hypothetical protein
LERFKHIITKKNVYCENGKFIKKCGNLKKFKEKKKENCEKTV